MESLEDWLPTDAPAEYRGCDLYGTFADAISLLFLDDGQVDMDLDFRKTSVREMTRAVRFPAALARSSEQTADTASPPPKVESVERKASEAARNALGLRAQEVPLPSAILWVVRDCGVSFCDVEGTWQEIRRPDDENEPLRYSVLVHLPARPSERECLPRAKLQTQDALALRELEVAAGELVVLLPTSGVVATWIWTRASKCYRLARGCAGAAAVFPVSFPEAAALRLVDENGIRLPFDGDPRGPGDILRTELLALSQSPKERVEAAVRWLLGRLARSASGKPLADLARHEAQKVLDLGGNSRDKK